VTETVDFEQFRIRRGLGHSSTTSD
jgi:hypothetical protein